jgi:hypothetical protein
MLIRLNSFITTPDRVIHPSSLYRSLFCARTVQVLGPVASVRWAEKLKFRYAYPPDVQGGSIAARFEQRTMSLDVSTLGASEPRSPSLSLITLPGTIFVLARSSPRLVSYAPSPSLASPTITVTTQDRLMFAERHCLVEDCSFGMDVLASDRRSFASSEMSLHIRTFLW